MQSKTSDFTFYEIKVKSQNKFIRKMSEEELNRSPDEWPREMTVHALNGERIAYIEAFSFNGGFKACNRSVHLAGPTGPANPWSPSEMAKMLKEQVKLCELLQKLGFANVS